jgi:hypothetical protein
MDATTDIAVQEALLAWETLRPGGPRPSSVEVVAGLRKKRTILRLSGAGPGGSAVIAKRCPPETAATERAVYERILPHVPITAPRYDGHLEGEKGWEWLFLEDVGTEPFDSTVPWHRMAAARWLGTLHAGAADIALGCGLPDRGARHYLDHLRRARRTILANIANPHFRAPDIEVMESVVRLLDTVEAGYAPIESFCARMPCTLVHGDFRRKNVFVRRAGGDVGIFPIDWEVAGWGVPAADLAPARGVGSGPQLDLQVYCAIVQTRWPQLDEPTVRSLTMVGKLFRRLAAIDWSVTLLAYPWPQKPISELRIYGPELAEAYSAAPWK